MKVFFRPEQSARNASSFSPSAGKPALVVKRWQGWPGVEITDFAPLSREDLALAHARSYVDAILDLQRSNGFGNKDAQVATSLPYTSGSFYAAARHAYVNDENAASPTSGFHHAGHDFGGCFCTFNGLMVAAQKLRRDFHSIKVGILDLDCHDGNGTADIIAVLGLKYVPHYSLGAWPIFRSSAEAWLGKLPKILLDFSKCDVLLYQAGADPHVNDPLGGVLTTKQMAERDRIVFQTMKDFGVPVAWNLAGGYQKPISKVLDLHDNTMKACLAVEAKSRGR